MPFSFKLSRRLALAHITAAVFLAACSPRDTGLSEPGEALNRITPDSITIAPSQTIQFLAYGDQPTTGVAAPIPVSWSATGGKITSDGVYTADTAIGTFDVRATDRIGHQAVAHVRTARPVKQVVLLPSTATIGTGATLQLGSYGLTSRGDSVGVGVSYSATGGTISAAGLYTASSLTGIFRVIATSAAGLADTSIITVSSSPPPPTTAVATVEVTPGSASVTAGATFQLRATTRDGAGNVLGGRTIAWSSSNTAVATVDGSGLVRAVAQGSTTIVATSEGKTGTANVAVEAVAAAVAAVQISPSSATVASGTRQQLTATLRDASGTVLTGRAITWLTTTAGVASVDGSGMVTAVGPGAATISAISDGVSGTAAITVPGTTAECAARKPEWIWCDDFEQDRLGSYFEYDNAGGNFTRTSGSGFNGSTGMRAHFNAGAQSAGSLHLAIGRTPSSYFRAADGGTANYRELYWRMYVRHQDGWTGGGGDKLTRAFIFANSNWAEAMIAHVWSGTSGTTDGNYLLVDPASGTDASGNLVTTAYNDFAHLSWMGTQRSVTPIFDGAHVGQWYCVEAHVKLNTAGSSDGVFELWINGSKEATRTGLNWVGSYSSYGLNAVYFENYWNAGSVKAQDRYFDNIVVSTARVGCAG